jgi:hypothetical protein
MAKILSSPWILPSILEITLSSDHPPSSSQFPLARRPKIVQVVRVYSSAGILIINDQQHTMAVLLSTECIQSFQHDISTADSPPSLDFLQNSIIKLEVWHYSTVIQCLGKRHFNSLTDLGISLPLALHCSKLSSLGAYDCSPIGSPVDINLVSPLSSLCLCLSLYLLPPPLLSSSDPFLLFSRRTLE